MYPTKKDRYRFWGREIKKLRNKEIPFVKVQWMHHDEREPSREMESETCEKNTKLFQD